MANLSAAPAPFTINGTQYYMSPLTGKDREELNNFIRVGIMQTARAFLVGEKDQKVIDATMRAALDKASRVDWMTDDSNLNSFPVISYLLWLGVKANDASVTREAWEEALLKEFDVNVDAAMLAFQLANPFAGTKVAKPQQKE